MSANGSTAPGARGRRTRRIVALSVALALVVFAGGYLLGRASAPTATPSVSETATPAAPSETLAPSSPATPTSPSPTEPSPSATPTEPTGEELPDGTYFVQLSDLQGGEEGPLLVVYDLASFLTGEQADQEAAARGMETPVPNGYFIVNDNPKLRTTPLSDAFSVKYIPEGSGVSTPVKAHRSQFLGWLSGSIQTDFPPKDTSWWWITIDNGEITTITQQYLP
jgi:hypothetical protein